LRGRPQECGCRDYALDALSRGERRFEGDAHGGHEAEGVVGRRVGCLGGQQPPNARGLETSALGERTLGDPLLLTGPLQDAQQGVAGAEGLDSLGVLDTLGLGEQRVERALVGGLLLGHRFG
jgi:hypothetical protein